MPLLMSLQLSGNKKLSCGAMQLWLCLTRRARRRVPCSRRLAARGDSSTASHASAPVSQISTTLSPAPPPRWTALLLTLPCPTSFSSFHALGLCAFRVAAIASAGCRPRATRMRTQKTCAGLRRSSASALSRWNSLNHCKPRSANPWHRSMALLSRWCLVP